MEPTAANMLWENVKQEDACYPIIMTERRYKEETALREKLRKEEEETEKMRILQKEQ